MENPVTAHKAGVVTVSRSRPAPPSRRGTVLAELK